MQNYLDFKHMIYRRKVGKIWEYIVEQSVSIRADPELIVGAAGIAVHFFGKALSLFSIPVARKMLKCISRHLKNIYIYIYYIYIYILSIYFLQYFLLSSIFVFFFIFTFIFSILFYSYLFSFVFYLIFAWFLSFSLFNFIFIFISKQTLIKIYHVFQQL